MGYQIFRGVIRDRKIVEGQAYYKVSCSSDSADLTTKLTANDVRHGYTSDPSGACEVYEIDTSVYVAGCQQGFQIRDGVIISAVSPRAGGYTPIKSPLQPIYDKLKEDGGESGDAEGLTGGDFFRKRGDGFVKFAYNGLLKLVSKLGLSIMLDPLGNFMHFAAQNWQFLFGNYGSASSEILPDYNEAKFNFWFINDPSETNPQASLINLDLGHVDDNGGRIKLTLYDAATGIPRSRLYIDRTGSVSIQSKDIKFKIKEGDDDAIDDAASLEIDKDGNAILKTTTFKLGKGEVEQYFIRGKEMQSNYDQLLKLLKEHEHPVVNGKAFRSFTLQSAPSDLKLTEGKELSTTNKLD